MGKEHLKAEKDLEDFQKNVVSSSNSVMAQLLDVMGEEKFNVWVEFNTKWTKFKKEGRNKEADLLEEKYLKENGK